jgi:hypothetical protein
MILSITPGAELPSRTLTWQQSDGTPIDFAASPHTFTLTIDFPTPLVKTAGISGDANGLVTIEFAPDETDDYPPGKYDAALWAKRTADDKDREPVRMVAYIYG